MDDVALVEQEYEPKAIRDRDEKRDRVTLMTLHAAKGLEFDTVLLPSLIAGRFPAVSRREALPLPDELIRERLPEGDEHLEEERRLAYVAMTRAKRQLHLMAAVTYGSGARPRKLSPFVGEALGLERAPEPTTVGGTIRTALFAITPTTELHQRLRYPEHDGVITLSPAKIEGYLRCPNEFYWRFVLNAPSRPTAQLIYGNAVHAGIEAFHRLRSEISSSSPFVKGGQGDFGPYRDQLITGTIDQFRANWQDEGFVSAKQVNDLQRRGEATLARFIDRNLTQPQPSRVESWVHLNLSSSQPIREHFRSGRDSIGDSSEVKENGYYTSDIAIRGRIDALWISKEIEIRDYKTSENVTDPKKALGRAKANVPLMIYGYAIRKETGRRPDRLTLDFVETDQLGVVEPTDEQLDAAAETIRTVAANIRAGRFDPNPDPRHPCDVCRTI